MSIPWIIDRNETDDVRNVFSLDIASVMRGLHVDLVCLSV